MVEASSINDQNEQGPTNQAGFEVKIKRILNDFGARIEVNHQHQNAKIVANDKAKFDINLKIDSNTKAISEISDLLSGLSMQFTAIMSEQLKPGGRFPNVSGSNLPPHMTKRQTLNKEEGGPEPRLMDLIGNPHQYASRLTKIDFTRF